MEPAAPPEIIERDGVAVIVLRGEHDMSTAGLLEAAIVSALDAGRPVIVDLSTVSFIDSSIAAVLLRARPGDAVAGVVAPPGEHVRKLLDLVEAGRVAAAVRRHAAALAAVGTG